MNTPEITIEGYPNYRVTREGNIHSYAVHALGSSNGMILKPQWTGNKANKYQSVGLYSDGELQSTRIHKIVWTTFRGEIPEGLEVDHIDGDKSNNHIDNLQLLTKRDNVQKKNRMHMGYVLRDHRVELIEDYKRLGSMKEVASLWNVSYMGVIRTIRDTTHKRLPNGKCIMVRYSDIDDEYVQKF